MTGLVGLADPVDGGRASGLDQILERVSLMARLLTNWNGPDQRLRADLDAVERRGLERYQAQASAGAPQLPAASSGGGASRA